MIKAHCFYSKDLHFVLYLLQRIKASSMHNFTTETFHIFCHKLLHACFKLVPYQVRIESQAKTTSNIYRMKTDSSMHKSKFSSTFSLGRNWRNCPLLLPIQTMLFPLKMLFSRRLINLFLFLLGQKRSNLSFHARHS